MRRRDFIRSVGAAVMWPLAARAQQPDQMRRIGVLMNTRVDAADGRARFAAFRQGLMELGWIDGRSVRIDDRWAAGNAERSRTFAKELVGLQPDVMLAQGTLSLRSLSQETRSIPIVFVNVSDPVSDGFVVSLAHPGGNITGFSQYEYMIGGKWLELLKEIAPGTARVAAIMNADNPASRQHLRTIESTAQAIGVRVIPMAVRNVAELERALDDFTSEMSGGVIVLPGSTNTLPREHIVGLAARLRLPAIYPLRDDVMSGGLMSYGVDPVDQHRRASGYVDRILQGEKPADMPIQQPVKYQLMLNLKTAKALGLDVPAILLARADEVIE